jgi:hypothetical protein
MRGVKGHLCRARSEGHACHARGSGMDDPTWRGGPDKQVPPSGPDKRVPPVFLACRNRDSLLVSGTPVRRLTQETYIETRRPTPTRDFFPLAAFQGRRLY